VCVSLTAANTKFYQRFIYSPNDALVICLKNIIKIYCFNVNFNVNFILFLRQITSASVGE